MWLTAVAALADQQYAMTGEDVYHIGSDPTTSRVEYTGTQRLTVQRQGKQARYDAQARYVRSSGEGTKHLDARFVQELGATGSFEDRIDEDPDFLTILNQPFAVQLDATTMRDLSALRKKVPFDATSPLGGEAVLHGFLRPGTGGSVNGRPTVAVRFEAEGPMSGPLPDHTEATMNGKMRMDGSAYYSMDDAMLLALDATLTIVAQLRSGQQIVPVRIVYRRTIRASESVSTPRPTPLPSDGGKEYRGIR
ncbi:MAG: hypothetical protein JO199_12800 [Candidatus Eremiobacteraeota bacterium]|nr:hypothetical protein [Candidatus Eremiobacteraeota bacterium]